MDSPADFHGETLSDLCKKIWRVRLSVLAGGCAGLILGGLLSVTLQPHYEAHMIVGPSLVQESSDALSSFETGRALPQEDRVSQQVPPEFVRFEQVLREATVARILSRYGGILEQVAQDRLFRFEAPDKLSADELSEYLRRHIKIEPIGATSSRRISYAHPDPEVAVRILKHLHTITDETIRQKNSVDTQERIGWLQKELSQAHNPDHRAALTTLLMTQERRRMLVAMDQPFAAELIEPPSAESRPAGPSVTLLVLICAVLGAGAGFMTASCRRQAA